MEIENQEVFDCEDDREYMVYCEICDKLCIERYYKNVMKSRIRTNKFYNRQRLINCFR